MSDVLNKEQKRIHKAIEHTNEYINSGELKPQGEIKLLYLEDEFLDYIKAIKENKIVSIDTETTGLDIFNIDITGICLYTPGLPAVYIPIYHTDIFGAKDYRCMNIDLVKQSIKEIVEDNSIKTIYHNAKYDLKVLKYIWGIDIDKSNIYWDTLFGAYMLSETEDKGLKVLHNKYIMKGKDTSKDFSDYFGKIPFNYVPLEIAYIYAANDAIKTYELYEFQKKYLNDDVENRKDLKKLYDVFRNIEMPLLPLLVDIELRGWKVDLDKIEVLEEEYSKEIKKYEDLIFRELLKIEDELMKNPEIIRLTKGNIEEVNFNSHIQAKAIFYDVLKLPIMNKRKGKSCDKECLERWLDKYNLDLIRYLLRYRELTKLYGTYISKLPNVLNKKTGKVHSSFNNVATDTGRFSSSDAITRINLQNIPTGDSRIRQLFIADEGKLLIGGDFSQIEPRVLASLSGDDNMRQAYENKVDLYSTMASKVYGVPYEECKEFNPDGTKNPEGKKRRTSVKSLLLGIMYCRGSKSIAEQLDITIKEADKLIQDFYKAYPKIKLYMDKVIYQAETIGYVNTKLGRKRRLPNMVKYRGDKDNGLYQLDYRKCLNAVIQGTSADIMKKTLINLYDNKELKDLGFQILATIHDEVIAQVPKENVVKAKELMRGIMLNTGFNMVGIVQSVDIEVSKCWYGENIEI